MTDTPSTEPADLEPPAWIVALIAAEIARAEALHVAAEAATTLSELTGMTEQALASWLNADTYHRMAYGVPFDYDTWAQAHPDPIVIPKPRSIIAWSRPQ